MPSSYILVVETAVPMICISSSRKASVSPRMFATTIGSIKNLEYEHSWYPWLTEYDIFRSSATYIFFGGLGLLSTIRFFIFSSFARDISIRILLHHEEAGRQPRQGHAKFIFLFAIFAKAFHYKSSLHQRKAKSWNRHAQRPVS